MELYKVKGQERYFLIDEKEALELEKVPLAKDRDSAPEIRTTKHRKKYEVTHGKPVEPKKRGRRRKDGKVFSYECAECTAVFASQDLLIDAVCPGCGSLNIKERT